MHNNTKTQRKWQVSKRCETKLRVVWFALSGDWSALKTLKGRRRMVASGFRDKRDIQISKRITRSTFDLGQG